MKFLLSHLIPTTQKKELQSILERSSHHVVHTLDEAQGGVIISREEKLLPTWSTNILNTLRKKKHRFQFLCVDELYQLPIPPRGYIWKRLPNKNHMLFSLERESPWALREITQAGDWPLPKASLQQKWNPTCFITVRDLMKLPLWLLEDADLTFLDRSPSCEHLFSKKEKKRTLSGPEIIQRAQLSESFLMGVGGWPLGWVARCNPHYIQWLSQCGEFTGPNAPTIKRRRTLPEETKRFFTEKGFYDIHFQQFKFTEDVPMRFRPLTSPLKERMEKFLDSHEWQTLARQKWIHPDDPLIDRLEVEREPFSPVGVWTKDNKFSLRDVDRWGVWGSSPTGCWLPGGSPSTFSQRIVASSSLEDADPPHDEGENGWAPSLFQEIEWEWKCPTPPPSTYHALDVAAYIYERLEWIEHHWRIRWEQEKYAIPAPPDELHQEIEAALDELDLLQFQFWYHVVPMIGEESNLMPTIHDLLEVSYDMITGLYYSDEEEMEEEPISQETELLVLQYQFFQSVLSMFKSQWSRMDYRRSNQILQAHREISLQYCEHDWFWEEAQ